MSSERFRIGVTQNVFTLSPTSNTFLVLLPLDQIKEEYRDSKYSTMAPPLSTLGRTSVVGWSPSNDTTSQLFATGTVSGALDDSFSTESLLELWEPFTSSSEQESRLEPIARISAPARFNRISWGGHGINSQERPLGVIAGGMENGQVALWDPSIALHHSEHEYVFNSLPSTTPKAIRE